MEVDVDALFDRAYQSRDIESLRTLLKSFGVSYGDVYKILNVDDDKEDWIAGLSTHGLLYVNRRYPKAYLVFLYPLTLDVVSVERKAELIRDRVKVLFYIESYDTAVKELSDIEPSLKISYNLLPYNFKSRSGIRELAEKMRRKVKEGSKNGELEEMVKSFIRKVGIYHDYVYEYELERVAVNRHLTSVVIDLQYDGKHFETIIVNIPENLKDKTPSAFITFNRDIEHYVRISVIPLSHVEVAFV